MLEINVYIHFPDADRLLERLAHMFTSGAEKTTATAAPAAAEPATKPAGTVATSKPEAPVAPTVAPTAAPAAPTAAPAFTREQVARAGADLLTSNPSLNTQLVGLINKYGNGAKTLMDVPADQLGAFAAELRALGAKI